ncbi:hypothetical protein [Actinomadura sp. KC216]|uniref:hypothetical protein n=1 Tax=Actinomadura sp. KC216 TaxID=2530370 RepID=UPI001A9D72B1|nr:hypothetical protein [Actinomadura sp. KC216]
MPGNDRSLFADRTFRRLMPAFALSDLGGGMSFVAWLALAWGPRAVRAPWSASPSPPTSCQAR